MGGGERVAAAALGGGGEETYGGNNTACLATFLSGESSFRKYPIEVLCEEKSCARKVTLNRPRKLNCLTFEMVSQIHVAMRTYENDAKVKLVIVKFLSSFYRLKGKGKAFCAGGDVTRTVLYTLAGNWTFAASFYRRQLMLDYLLATYKKPLVFLINGIVMGGGAGLSMNGMFRIVTENTVSGNLKCQVSSVARVLAVSEKRLAEVFAMPEVLIGHFPDVGASYFLSRLPGYYGEYLGLTGARINGVEMLACGLATHFVLSKDLQQLENALCELVSSDALTISKLIDKFIYSGQTNQDNFHERLETINKCFCKDTVEEILLSLEEMSSGVDKWIVEAISSLKSASPTSLKIGLRSIREGRKQTLELCIAREYIICSHVVRGTVTNDFFEGARALLFEKDKKPKHAFQPSRGICCLFRIYQVGSFIATRKVNPDTNAPKDLGARADGTYEIKFCVTSYVEIFNTTPPWIKPTKGCVVEDFKRAVYRSKEKWEPSQLCQVSEEMLDKFSAELDDDDFKCLQLPARSSPSTEARAKL
ncbi:hypothetical protein RHSIM_Rhsim07G0072300 [Rhododendron simsii]|uniref:3-hydroxyisobutyryl-CoA hydrolase n=1 Tax=Rhododendron simsii TaxID=118357 RepID=A0A834LL76_RHOSS|nr:hypothetical protein RHSIM_Rhsim07G0072300 [Rhododendron simsii]